MKWLIFLSLWFIIASATAQSGLRAREVWISAQNYGDPPALMIGLNQALLEHRAATRFHFDWGLAAPHGGSGGELIYDKKREVLWIRAWNYTSWPDDEDSAHPIYEVTNSSQQWRFSRVTPNRLRLLVARYRRLRPGEKFTDTENEVSFFPRLSQFGCRGGLVGRTAEHFHQKLVKDHFVRVR